MTTGCKCCGREAEHSDDCLIPENARLRAALQKAEAERDAQSDANIEIIKTVQRVAAERDSERARAERYLAAIMEIGDDRAFIRGDWDTRFCEVRIGIETWRAIRTLVEEARRG